MCKVKEKEDSYEAIPKKSIWKFYRWAVVIAPILLMLSHWYIFYVFSQNTHELLKYSSVNEICIAWIYSILYLYVPFMILPASYFFKWNNIFRIPFVYFIFINVERWYYSAWFCTNEMINTHYFLIHCIISMYAIEMLGLLLKHRKEMPKYIVHTIQRIKIHKHKDDKYNRMINILEEKESC